MSKKDFYLGINDSNQPFGFDENASGYSRGFYKAVTEWLKCLFTVPGTDVSDPEYGTPFANLVKGSTLSAAFSEHVAEMSINAATDIIQSYQKKSRVPEHEQISIAEMVRAVSPSPDELVVEVKIKNAAGESMSLRLPLDLV